MEKNKQLTIAFHVYNFSFRGTESALYDYANKNETLLKNKSIIVVPEIIHFVNNPDVIMKFTSRFKIFLYKNYNELYSILKKENINAMYIIKAGNKDELTNYFSVNFTSFPLLIHCVYRVNDPHGLIYAGISEEVVKNKIILKKEEKEREKNYDFVPHMITLNETNKIINLRNELKIPKDAIVFGRHGGLDTFNLPNLKLKEKENLEFLLLKILKDNENIHFIFMPRPYILNNINHDRLHYIETSIDPIIKKSFINACDAMIHCQILGESFGISVLEFSSMNKPVITWNGGTMKQHLLNLENKAILYNTYEELYNILVNFKKENYDKGIDYWNVALPKFNDINVMEKFNNVFLKQLY